MPSIQYEWAVEYRDPEYPSDILDTFHTQDAEEALREYLRCVAIGRPVEFVLIRDVFTWYGRLDDRQWAYVDSATMTLGQFTGPCGEGYGATKMPAYKVKELSRAVKAVRS